MISANDVAKVQHDELKQKIKDQKEKITGQNKEIKSKLHRKDRILKNNQEMVLEIKKKENEIVKVKSDNKDGYNKVCSLII
jgi:structural maintenance of chromosome 2